MSSASSLSTRIDVNHYHVFGIPCCGKGEHGFILEYLLGKSLQKIEMGQEFRNEIFGGTAMGLEIADTVWVGDLLPDKYVAQIIDRYDLTKDTLFDGFPRKDTQESDYNARNKHLLRTKNCRITPKIISIETDPEISVGRMGIRIAGAIRKGKPVRPDDIEKILRHRISIAQTITSKVLKAFKARGYDILELDGNTDFLKDRPEDVVAFFKNLDESLKVKNDYTDRVRDMQKFITK